jgi:hypothetical protein
MTAHQQLVIDYFDQTHNDYQLLLGIDRHFGLHCDFFDRQRRGHDDAVLHMNRVLFGHDSLRVLVGAVRQP